MPFATRRPRRAAFSSSLRSSNSNLAEPAMVPIKIQCSCGQRYQFEVEPVSGRVPSPVTCPACGTDGTDAANAALAQTAQPQATAAGAGPLRIAAPVRAEAPAAPASPWTAARRRVPPQPGQTDRMQAKYE